jgi:serine/threonine-protein kinase RsbT
MFPSFSIFIGSEVDIKYAQYECLKVMNEIQFKELDKIKISTIISELSYNIIKYAEKGMMRISQLEEGYRKGLLIEAIDQGPGIEDIERVFEDKYSTGGTLGLGLPGIKRMADEVLIESEVGKGTHVRVKFFSHA